jgi:nucleotide-binding universal stress UspA family protein
MDTTTSAGAAVAQQSGPGQDARPAALGRILVALDASEHANRALEEALRLASDTAVITGIHAYAARLHDRRFRQMEGGLPERYLDEEEMGYQREVHDDLISRGLNIISDSYHDVAQVVCDEAGRAYRRLSPEGKNYRQIVTAAESGDFDLLVLGAVGLGAVPGSQVGTVCERVVRRSPIDTLVIRDPARAIGDGPIVVALDGSRRSFGALMTALALRRRLGVPVHAVAAYDPYYHYVAFNKIAGVLSEEAGQVFRFKEQEQLHEELIDEGIAKIYQSHLEVARRVAEADGSALLCELLDGKPYRAILGYLEKVGASLLVLGKTGVHADPALDIGGNAENLLRLAPCHLWLGQTTHTPPEDVVAEETISWSTEAEALLARAPEFARGMARKAVIRFAHERGHTFITADIVEEVADKLMPGRQAVEAAAAAALEWSAEAGALVDALSDPGLAANIRLRAEKHARRLRAPRVEAAHV